MRTLILVLMLGTLLAGCGKKPKEEAKTPPASGGGDSDFMVVDGGRVASGGGGQPNPQRQPASQGGGGGNTNFQPGGGAVQNVRKAGLRTISINDMRQLGISISQTVALDDRMPSAQEIKQGLQQDRNLLAAINEGAIILTDTKNKKGLWAYEVDADTKGGIVLAAGTASRASADEVKQYLANK